jgi:hypothetical protein
LLPVALITAIVAAVRRRPTWKKWLAWAVAAFLLAVLRAAKMPPSSEKVTPVTGTIARGVGHTVVLAIDGTVWAWGDNGSVQLGDGTTENRLTPVQVKWLTDVVVISASVSHNFALKEDGTVWAWGPIHSVNWVLDPKERSGI